MKYLRLSTTLMLLGTLTFAIADVSVDDQISEIKNASPEKRVVLMNEFKQRLFTLSSEERAKAITQLRSTMQTKNSEQLQTQTREKSRVKQMEQSDNMQRVQQMSQNRAASQAMKQSIGSSQSGSNTPNKFMGRK